MAKINLGKDFDKETQHEKLTKNIENTVQYPLRIPKSMYKRLKIQLANDEMRLRDLLLQMIEEYLNKETLK